MNYFSKYFEGRKVSGYLSSISKFVFRTILVALIIKYALFTPGKVHGTSMEPNFFLGARFIVNKIPYYWHEPGRYDVVQAVSPIDENKLIIKRIIGLPGEKILIINNKVFITKVDGGQIELEEPYLYDGMKTRKRTDAPIEETIPTDHYYILGDNRLTSRDSREFGPVHRKYINGPIIPLYRGEVSRTQELSGTASD